MRHSLSVLLASPVVFCAAAALGQNSGDGSDLFLSAYSNFQKAEAMEKRGESAAALALYEQVAKSLNQLVSEYPGWSPQVVKLRTNYTLQAIQRLKAAGVTPGAAKPKPVAQVPQAPVAAPAPLSQAPLPPEPRPERTQRPASQPSSSGGSDASPLIPKLPERAGVPIAPTDPFADIQSRLTQLQNDLQFALDEAQRLRREKAELVNGLEEVNRARVKAENTAKILEQRSDVAERALLAAKEENAKSATEIAALEKDREALKQQKRELQAEQEASEELRRRLEGRLAQALGREGNSNTERNAANQKVTEISKQLTQLQIDLEKANKEKTGLQAKLDQTTGERDQAKAVAETASKERQEAAKQREQSERAMLQAGMERDAAKAALVKVSQERDDAVALATKLKEARGQIDKLEAENRDAAAKLAEAQKLLQKRRDDPKAVESLKKLQEEVEGVRNKLADSQKKAEESEKNASDLQNKLDLALKETVVLKNESQQASADRDREHEEKELLQGILRRTLVEQSKRESTRKSLVAEVSKLKIDSDVLVKQIGLLGEPILQLTEKEQALFKQPLVEISEEGISISAIKTSKVGKQAQNGKPAKPATEAPPPPAVAASDSSAADSKKAADSAAARSGDAFGTRMSEAKDRFEKGDFEGAEKLYQEVLDGSPGNAFVLSNLGVAQFRARRFAKAEETLRKALDLAPQDAFSRSTLGIVYYTQGKLDKAVEELTQSVAINPNNAVAHNYLGIATSRKGWQENARKEFETATSLDPNYAEAFFNLAVVCASQKPPDKSAARDAYKRATELGAAPDPRLEELIR